LAGGCGSDIETESVCVQLDITIRSTYIRDYQFARYRFFDLAKFGGVNYIGPGDTIMAFFLYQSVRNLDPYQPEAVAYPNALDPTSSPDSVIQRFRQLGFGYDYELLIDEDAGQYTVFFPTPLQNIQTTTIAYYMLVKKADGSTLAFGDLSGATLFRLQMLKRSNSIPSDPLWEAEWKNVYEYWLPGMRYGNFDIDIYKGVLGDEENPDNTNNQSGQRYLSLLGLDSLDSSGQPIPDGQIDGGRGILLPLWHLLIFPDRHPFANSGILDDPIPLLYETLNANDLRDSSRYYLKVIERPGRSYRLPHINIVEESEEVARNGHRLTRGVDYNIDYSAGEIDFFTSPSDSDSLAACFDYWK
jgi:hypothetical protein